MTSATKVPMRVALQEQLNKKGSAHVTQSEFGKASHSIKSLVQKGAKSRSNLRNEPLIGSGLASAPNESLPSTTDDISPEIQISYARLRQLKHQENLTQTIKQSGLEFQKMTAKLEIP